MLRREFLGGLAAAALSAKGKAIGRDRISYISDECARTPEAAIAFGKQYGLRWIELRETPEKAGHYARQGDEYLRTARKQFDDAGLRVSFLNTGFFKILLPGVQHPDEKRVARHQQQFERRFADLEAAIRAAHILGVDKMRVFTFVRVPQPEAVEDQVVNLIGDLAERTQKEGVRLLVENEDSCNAATSTELARIVNKLPEKSVGLNWDAMNGMSKGEVPFPDGYNSLPKKRIGNVQIKGHTLLTPKWKLDWAAIFAALARDGYRGHVGLETHIFGEVQIAKSHESMQEILRIIES